MPNDMCCVTTFNRTRRVICIYIEHIPVQIWYMTFPWNYLKCLFQNVWLRVYSTIKTYLHPKYYISYDILHIFHLKDYVSPTIRGTLLNSFDLKTALAINISFMCINRWADNLSIRSFLTAEKFLIDITQGLICIKFII